MRPRLFALFAAALALAAPLTSQVQPAVQPGGDIPSKFHPAFPPPPEPAARPRYLPPGSAYLYKRRELMVPMRDGVRLYTVLIIPRGAKRAPILLDRTPYSADKATGAGYPGPWPENILPPIYAELVRAGYIVALQDVRGKYKSGGDYVMTRPLRGPLNRTNVDHSTDAWDTIDWLVKHVPESNGRVGTIGISYNGFTALMSLVTPHTALKAVVPINPMVDGWKGDDWFHNGAFRQEMMSFVYGQTADRRSDQQWLSGYDEYTTYLRYGSAGAYAHSLGMEQLPFWQRLTSHPAYDSYWQDQALDRIIGQRPLTVPTLLVSSYWDPEDIYGATAVFQAVKAHDNGNAHLVLGPWNHGQVNGAAFNLGPLEWGIDTGHWFRANILIPFLNQYLKDGPGSGIARVTAFDVGPNQWQRLDDWPLPACPKGCPVKLWRLYLTADHHLSTGPPASHLFDTYLSDPAKPVTYRAAPNLSPWASGSTWRTWLTDDQRFAALRPDVLSYSSQPLKAPLKLTGTPLVHLLASTSGSDSDWVVKLIDVYPDPYPARPGMAGYQLPIAMDVIRGRYRLDPAHPAPLTPDKPLTYDFALPSVDYVIEPGHRLMIQVQSSWFPLYDRNPQTFVPNIFFAKPEDYRAATQRVFTGADGSWVGLPIVN